MLSIGKNWSEPPPPPTPPRCYIVTTWQGCSLYYFNELEKKCGDRGSRSYFLWGGGGGEFNFFLFSRNPIIHIVCIYQYFFQMVCTYSLLTILYNYLQMNNQITILMKKKCLRKLMQKLLRKF